MKLRKSIRLCDITVLCGRCNTKAGSSKPGSDRFNRWAEEDGDVLAETPDSTLGGDPLRLVPRPACEAPFASHTANGGGAS